MKIKKHKVRDYIRKNIFKILLIFVALFVGTLISIFVSCESVIFSQNNILNIMLLLFGFSFSAFVIVHSILCNESSATENAIIKQRNQKSISEGISDISFMVCLLVANFIFAFLSEAIIHSTTRSILSIMFYFNFSLSVVILFDLFSGVLQFLKRN